MRRELFELAARMIALHAALLQGASRRRGVSMMRGLWERRARRELFNPAAG